MRVTAITHKIASQREKEMKWIRRQKEDPAVVQQNTDNRHHSGSINIDKWKTYV